MMKKRLLQGCFLAIFLKKVSCTNTNPRPTPHPVEFSINFVTNITDTDASNPISGKLFYSWPLQSQRIHHAAGSYECRHFYNTSEKCSLLFVKKGMYRFLGDDENCCLDLPGVGTPPPDWAMRANPTFVGPVHDAYSGLDTFEWAFDNLTTILSERIRKEHGVLPYHTTRQVASPQKLAGLPVLFTFPGQANGRQDYHYNVRSIVTGPQDPSLFRLPEDCRNVLCSKQHVKVKTSAIHSMQD